MSNITETMQKAIAENLPEMAAKEMKQFIEEAEKVKIDLLATQILLKESRDQVHEISKKLNYAEERIQNQEQFAEDKKALKIEAETIYKAQFDLDKTILEIKLLAAEASNAKVMSLVEKVFGHPSVTVTNTKETPVAVEGSQGCGGWVSREITEDKTKTIEGKS